MFFSNLKSFLMFWENHFKGGGDFHHFFISTSNKRWILNWHLTLNRNIYFYWNYSTIKKAIKWYLGKIFVIVLNFLKFWIYLYDWLIVLVPNRVPPCSFGCYRYKTIQSWRKQKIKEWIIERVLMANNQSLANFSFKNRKNVQHCKKKGRSWVIKFW